MRKWAIVPIMGLIWIVGLAYESGLGLSLDIYGKMRTLTIAVFLFQTIFQGNFRKISYRTLLGLGLIFISIVYHFVAHGGSIQDYLWVYLLIPVISRFDVGQKQMRMISMMFGVLGGVVLFLANYHTIFKGWNTNSIGMIAFFSYMVFIGSFSKTKDRKIVLFLLLYSLAYFAWLEILNCRSSTLFSVIALLSVFSVIPMKKVLRVKQSLFWILLIPLLIALLVVLVHDWPFVEDINNWSKQRFGKAIFNGREELWQQGLHLFVGAPLLGWSHFGWNFHNSAITMLFGCGVVGFGLWIQYIKNLLKRAVVWLQDSTVYGLVIAFLMIWLQQSVELGLVAPKGNVVPFAILGLLMARVRMLEEENAKKSLDPDPGI